MEIKQLLAGYTAQLITKVPNIIISLLLFIAFWIGGLILQKIIRRLSVERNLNQELLNLAGRVAKISMIIFGAVSALGTLGINVSALVTGLGLTGFAVGFALKDTLSNSIAGVMILLHNPFRLNDVISVAGYEGIVAEINLRYTTIKSDGKVILIPNSTLFKNAITVLQTVDTTSNEQVE